MGKLLLLPVSLFLLLVLATSEQVDVFLASPDVDTKTGFFPDSGYSRSGQPGSSPQDPLDARVWSDSQDLMGSDNKLQSGPDLLMLKPNKMQLPDEKIAKLAYKQNSLPLYSEDTGYLVMFTGTKEFEKKG